MRQTAQEPPSRHTPDGRVDPIPSPTDLLADSLSRFFDDPKTVDDIAERVVEDDIAELREAETRVAAKNRDRDCLMALLVRGLEKNQRHFPLADKNYSWQLTNIGGLWNNLDQDRRNSVVAEFADRGWHLHASPTGLEMAAIYKVKNGPTLHDDLDREHRHMIAPFFAGVAGGFLAMLGGIFGVMAHHVGSRPDMASFGQTAMMIGAPLLMTSIGFLVWLNVRARRAAHTLMDAVNDALPQDWLCYRGGPYRIDELAFCQDSAYPVGARGVDNPVYDPDSNRLYLPEWRLDPFPSSSALQTARLGRPSVTGAP